MNRRLLVSMMAFGAVITLVGAAGIFAVFTDRAMTGSSSVTSGARASAADLKISTLQDGACSLPADNLVTDLFTITNAQPTNGFLGAGTVSPGQAFVCLNNAGSASLAISVAATDLVDVETACTGDEAAAGDASCGPAAPSTGVGELSSVLVADFVQVDCGNLVPIGGIENQSLLSELPGGVPVPGLSLLPGEGRCVRIEIHYPLGTSDTAVQIAQTDQATWRFAFDGTTS